METTKSYEQMIWETERAIASGSSKELTDELISKFRFLEKIKKNTLLIRKFDRINISDNFAVGF